MSQKLSQFLVVGIGASAGGIGALQEFFAQVPAASGCAYVVILHLSPEHDSQLVAILQSVTPLPVTSVSAQVRVVPNHIYVVPPNQHLTMVDGDLRVSPNRLREERRAPIDIFFRTLADTHGPRAVCVILSGSGSDGALGLKRVKEHGGAVFVQNPREAEFAEMPRCAIATDLVDAVLSTTVIPAHIVAYQASLGVIATPEEPERRPEQLQQALREVFSQLRTRTGHDFANYKHPTLLRRIERRISVCNLPDLPAYARFLPDHPDEVHALLKDLLISVTNFFRDREAFLSLEQDILPRIFAGKQSGEQVRVWVVGCATGQEAYSIAMLCAEHSEGLLAAPSVQVFATDIDEAAIARARQGRYSASDVVDVSPERLRRFFTLEADGCYQVRPELRETVLFANHNLLKDPPFSRIDLVSCRNVLIYLNQTAQERVMATLHFALKPGGYLFLGTSESIDAVSDLFSAVSHAQPLFQHRVGGTRRLPVPERVAPLRVAPPRVARLGAQADAQVGAQISASDLQQRLPSDAEMVGRADEPTMRQLEAELASLMQQLRTSSEQYEFQTEELQAMNEELRAANEELETSKEELQSLNEELRTVNQELKVKIEEATLHSTNLQNLVNSADVGTIFLDRGLHVKLFTPAARALFNLIPADYGRPLADITHRLRDGDVLADVETVLASLQTIEREVRTSDERVYMLRVLPYRSGDERIDGVVLTFFDITERTRAERALAEQARLLDLSNDAIIVRDVDNRVVYWNRRASEFYGWSREEAIGQDLHTLLQTELEAPVEQLLVTLREHERMEREVVQVTRDGRRLTLLCRWALDRDAAGQPRAILTTSNDITKRKEMEQVLHERERDFRAIFEGSSVGKAQIDPATRRFLRVNTALCAMTGYSESELLALTVDDLTHPDDRARDRARFAQLARGQASYEIEKRYVRKDRAQIWVQVNGNVMEAVDGQVLRVVAVIQDITARKQAEAALRVSEAKYRTLFETMDEGFCILELLFDAEQRPVDYRYLEINPAFERQTGMRGALGRTIRELVPEIEPFWREHYGRVALTGEPTRLVDYAASMGRWFDVNAFRIGEPEECKVAVLFTDITARKRREAHLAFFNEIGVEFARLSSAEELIQAIGAKIGPYLQITSCVFVDVDELRGELTVNYAWHTTDVPSLRRTFRTTEYLTEAFAQASRAGAMVVITNTQTDPRTDAQAYAALDIGAFVTVPFQRDGVWTAYLALTDRQPRDWQDDELELIEELANRIFPRLERARADAALRESEARLQELYAQEQAARMQAEEANRLKDDFLATVSHELRTPLTALLGYIYLLQRRPRDQEYIARTVEKMVQSAQAQAVLIEDLLDVSRIVSGQLRIEPQVLNLIDVIDAAIDTVRPTLELKRLALQADLDPAASVVIGDAHRLQQVVWNLLANAAKFTPPQGRIKVQLAADGSSAMLRVSDTGQGIREEFLPYVFERFRQGDGSSKRIYGGLGLGLAIVRHLVELHGGTVEASSAGVGEGATFTVRLPQAEADEWADQTGSAMRDGTESDVEQLLLGGLRLLVVDDQPHLLELLAEILVAEGATVQTCATAPEALALVQSWQPDVLVSDIAMPEHDGYWLIQQVRSLPAREGGATPAVALTAYVRMDDQLRVLAAGFEQYVPKPVNATELRDVIRSLAFKSLEC